jgi:thiaminase
MQGEGLLAQYAHLFTTFQNEHFFLAVANDSITPRQIGTFLVQDAHYLRALADRLRDLAQLAEDGVARSILQEHARDADNLPDVAQQIVAQDLGLFEVAREDLRPPTRAYIEHQRRSVSDGVGQGMLSILPCYLFYPYFVTAIRSKASESQLLQKCLPFVSSEKQAHCWAEELLEVWNRIGPAEPSPEAESAFVLSAQFEAALLDTAMK